MKKLKPLEEASPNPKIENMQPGLLTGVVADLLNKVPLQQSEIARNRYTLTVAYVKLKEYKKNAGFYYDFLYSLPPESKEMFKKINIKESPAYILRSHRLLIKKMSDNQRALKKSNRDIFNTVRILKEHHDFRRNNS